MLVPLVHQIVIDKPFADVALFVLVHRARPAHRRAGVDPVVPHSSADASGRSSVVVEQPTKSRPTTDTAFAL